MGDYARYIGVGLMFVCAVAVLAFAGFLVDRLLGTLPLFLMVGILAGFAGGLYYVYLLIKRLDDR